MYIRAKTRRGHEYYSVVTGVRCADTTKQKTVLTLGRLDNLSPTEICEKEERIRLLNEPVLLDRFWEIMFTLGYSVHNLISIGESLHYGDIVVFYTIANRIELPQLISKIIPKGGGPNIGRIITIMAICQSLAPTSKRDLRNWYEETALKHITDISPSNVEEWNLYACMRYLTRKRIEKIEYNLVQKLVELYDIDLDTCLYDLTSTFFYGNKDVLKLHGYSRDHMNHLVQVVIGLAVTKNEGLPVKHWLYPGNTPDVSVLPQAAANLKQLYGNEHDITLVFDRGNLSKKNIIILDEMKYDYICGLKRNMLVVKDILRSAMGKREFKVLKTILDENGKKKDIKGCAITMDLWERERKVVICYSEALEESERISREKAIEQAKNDLVALQEKTKRDNMSHDVLVVELYKALEGVSKYFNRDIIDHPPTTELVIQKIEKAGQADQRIFRWADPKIEELKNRAHTMTPEEVRKELKTILSGKKKYYRYRIKEVSGRSEFNWELKPDVVEQSGEFDGYYAVMSTNTEISLEDIVEINDSRDIAEKAFQSLKNPIRIRPIRHWVPRMVRAHIYICILGYLLRQMLRFLMKRKGLDYSINEALVELRRIKLIQIGKTNETPTFKITHLTERQKEILELAGVHYEPPVPEGV